MNPIILSLKFTSYQHQVPNSVHSLCTASSSSSSSFFRFSLRLQNETTASSGIRQFLWSFRLTTKLTEINQLISGDKFIKNFKSVSALYYSLFQYIAYMQNMLHDIKQVLTNMTIVFQQTLTLK